MSGKGNSSGVTTILALIYHVCEEAKRVNSDAAAASGRAGTPDSPLFVLFKTDMHAGVRQRGASAFSGRLSKKKTHVVRLRLRGADSSVSAAA